MQIGLVYFIVTNIHLHSQFISILIILFYCKQLPFLLCTHFLLFIFTTLTVALLKTEFPFGINKVFQILILDRTQIFPPFLKLRLLWLFKIDDYDDEGDNEKNVPVFLSTGFLVCNNLVIKLCPYFQFLESINQSINKSP